MENREHYKSSFLIAFKEMTARYGPLWKPSDPTSLSDTIGGWLEKLQSVCSDHNAIPEVFRYSMSLSDFARRPVSIAEFPEVYRMWVDHTNVCAKAPIEVSYAAKSIISKLVSRYQGLFPNHDIQTLDLWVEECAEANLTENDLNSGYQALKNKAAFRKYPPNINDFIEICRIIKVDKSIPLTCEIYDALTGNKPKISHPLVKKLIGRIGSHEIRTNRSEGLRKKIESEYKILIDDFLLKQPQVNNIQPNFQKESLKDVVETKGEPENIITQVKIVEKSDLVKRIDLIMQKLA